jgi:hypothetical protein
LWRGVFTELKLSGHAKVSFRHISAVTIAGRDDGSDFESGPCRPSLWSASLRYPDREQLIRAGWDNGISRRQRDDHRGCPRWY